MNMRLRLATLDDVSVLQYWDTKDHIISAGGADDSYDWEKEIPRNVPWQEILIAEVDGRPVGVITVIDPKEEETHYWGEIEPDLRALDIWIGEESDLGHGYGSEMMKLVLDRCFANEKVKAVLVDPLVSNSRAHTFYEKCGFRKIERKQFGKDDCFVYRIDRLQS
jgi:aminoglycoside 6'-N-acetyltransferase